MLKTLLLQPGVKSSFARKATLSHGYWYFNLSHGSGGVRPLPLSFLTQAPLSVPSPSTTKSRYDSSWRGREIWGVGWVWLGRKNNLENNIVKCQTKEQGYIYTYYVSYIYIYDTTARQPPAPKHRNPQDFFTLPMGRKVKNLESEHKLMTLGRRVLRMRRMGIFLDFNPMTDPINEISINAWDYWYVLYGVYWDILM